jgi:hypothetical protein
MTIVPNQTPATKPRSRRPWTDWLVITLVLAFVWCGLCWCVQMMSAG